MKRLNIDIETYSDNDIKFGVYKYVDTPNFEILIFAYAVDGGPVHVVDMTKDDLPREIIEALTDPKVTKVAYNAQFERVAIGRHLGQTLDPTQWECTMVRALEMGLPMSLKYCADFLGLAEQKDSAGTHLINYFSKPCKATKANDGRTRNLPEHDIEKWGKFMDYCRQDVVTEMAIYDAIKDYPIPDKEWELYAQDQRMHDYGVAVDIDLAESAVSIDEEISEELKQEMKEITGLDNPGSVKQLKDWLEEQGSPFETLGKALVQEAIDNGVVTGDVKRVLELRLALSNTSTKKYVMMEDAVTQDGRMHGILQFYGASRTGRYAGRLIQVQNLPRNYMKLLDDARDLVKSKDRESLEIVFDDVPDVLKQLIRTTLIPKEGYEFLISDFSAIEARVIAWYAQEEWVLDAFRDHGKIYEATANQMFSLGGIENVTSEMRQRGKVATLALGYQGGVGSLKSMGALNMGIDESELQPLVDTWREANGNIVDLWHTVEKLAIKALDVGGVVNGPKGLKFFKKDDFLFITLPSGRNLSYADAKLVPGKFGLQIEYKGQGTRAYFTKQTTYGGKLVENIVQATARDILAEALLRLEDAGYNIVFHVHDEAVAEMPKGQIEIEAMNELMAQIPIWAKGLPLGAEGFKTNYYMKD